MRQLTKKTVYEKDDFGHQKEVGDFNSVKKAIQSVIFINNQALSITSLHTLYKVGYGLA